MEGGQGKAQVARRHRPSRGGAVRHPWDLGARLPRGAGTMATGMRGVPRKAAAGTGVGVPAVRRRPAGLEVVPHVLWHRWDGMVTTGRRPVKAEESGAGPRGSAGRPPGWRTWAGGGRRSPGGTPAWAGGGPPGRRAQGRRRVARGCGVLQRSRVVVARDRWPRSLWSVQTSTPAASRWGAKPWRSVWIP